MSILKLSTISGRRCAGNERGIPRAMVVKPGEDGSAGHFVAMIDKFREIDKNIKIEIPVPDFGGSAQSCEKVLENVK